MNTNQAGANPLYWVLEGQTPSGPCTADQIHARLTAGELTWSTRVCRLGETTWLPLVQTPGFGPVPASAAYGPASAVLAGTPGALPGSGMGASEPTPHATVTKSASELSKFLFAPGPFLVVVVVLALWGWAMGGGQPTARSRSGAAGTQPVVTVNPSGQPNQPDHWQPAPQRARLTVAAADGTAVLQRLAAQLPPAELQALGLSVLLTGVDVYGIQVRLSNTGTVPVRVFPGNLRIHFGQETAGVATAAHPLFLRAGVVQPGYYVEGVVMYQATVEVGAVIRSLGTTFSYEDSSIEVTYRR